MPTRQQARHARTPPARATPGPVTAAFSVVTRTPPKPARIAIYAWPVIPVLALIPAATHDRLLNYADTVLGFDATLCLVACLAVTPLITIARAKITKLRWWYGIWVFILGAAGLTIHIVFPPGGMPQRVSGNAIEWTGLLIVTLLLPMTITSNAVTQKLLGPEWKRWQRNLMWAVWAVTAIHFLTMQSWVVLIGYSACTLPAITLRVSRIRKSVKDWRAGGYSTGGWWMVIAILGTVTIAGLSILTALEVHAIVVAVALR
jgi:DMSO/TMAO reductase YedYZ heme-binding membrane subunit